MIHLEHLNLVVTDLDRSLAFYRTAFPQWRVRGGGEGSWHGKARRWLHYGDDYQYLTLNDNGAGHSRELAGHQPGLAHFAFVTSNLDALESRMTGAGYPVSSRGAPDSGRRNLYFIDPDGMEVEFVEYSSDDPALRNQYPA
ncbi:VOC family protein [Aeromonas schubertii]|uniref:VOC family protein n=1 Tax=Aeromonas schubertii TaxID=652 RepID=A0ABS7V7B7_9GAMM|nr:VOC family protein [Aeromonas schubertii]KUE81820.1 glyoxalase [Aeromonas schubertii]MBZ6065276.1 VOC family protein [Aeromonas schubertii]MBZ6071471.1 VOC family protein [Aeromonas schubertii]